ncbi:hypothetical protein ADICYQ_0803 [Cyclobacterium qasimii M12-11B]|nr:hypothetical protein ADICYQ_0803 [Cyclobacterium qasimii M12-11B]
MGEQILSALNKEARFKTFRAWEPIEKTHNNDLKADFRNKQDQLSNYILQLEPYLGNNLMITSPGNKWIVYPLDTAIEIILSHEKRHLSQIKKQLNLD